MKIKVSTGNLLATAKQLSYIDSLLKKVDLALDDDTLEGLTRLKASKIICKYIDPKSRKKSKFKIFCFFCKEKSDFLIANNFCLCRIKIISERYIKKHNDLPSLVSIPFLNFAVCSYNGTKGTMLSPNFKKKEEKKRKKRKKREVRARA